MAIMKFKYKGYYFKIEEYGWTGSVTKMYAEYYQNFFLFKIKRKKFLMLNVNYNHIVSFHPLSNEMVIRFANTTIEKLKIFISENKTQLDSWD
jgi:hypothetical protein